MVNRHLGMIIVGMILALSALVIVLQRDRATAVEVKATQLRELRPSFTASGSLRFRDQVELSPEVIGTVVEVFVKEGDRVDSGDLLLRIDDRTLRAEVEQQQALVEIERLNVRQGDVTRGLVSEQYDRVAALFERGFANRAGFDEAEARLRNAQLTLNASGERLRQAVAALERAREQLAKTVIRAPVSGTVVEVNIEEGETAVPSSIGIAGSSLMTVANTDTLIAEINVGEADISRVHAGQQVSLNVAAYPDRSFAGRITFIALSPAQDNSALAGAGSNDARTYAIEAVLPSNDRNLLRPGMSCRAEIFTTAPSKAVAVPLQAILYEDERGARDERPQARRTAARKPYLFVYEDGRAVRRNVVLGVSDDSHQEIRSGLSMGEKVVVGPYRDLRFMEDGDSLQLSAGDGE